MPFPLPGWLYAWPGVEGVPPGELASDSVPFAQWCVALNPPPPPPPLFFKPLILPFLKLFSHLLFGCSVSLGIWLIGFKLIYCFIVYFVRSSRRNLTVTKL